MENLSLVVSTCDAHMQLMDGFFTMFNKYWPDYNGEIVINTEKASYECDDARIRVHNITENVTWSKRLKETLLSIKNEYILFFLDDFYLNGAVDNSRFDVVLNTMQQNHNIKQITFLTEPGGNDDSYSLLEGFCERKHFCVYRVTAHISLWRKDELLRLLRENENAWQFEVNGTVRSWLYSGKYFCKTKEANPVFPYDYGLLVVKGKYYGPVKRRYEQQEGLRFKELPVTEEYSSTQGGTGKKLKYLFGGIASIFQK